MLHWVGKLREKFGVQDLFPRARKEKLAQCIGASHKLSHLGIDDRSGMSKLTRLIESHMLDWSTRGGLCTSEEKMTRVSCPESIRAWTNFPLQYASASATGGKERLITRFACWRPPEGIHSS